MYYIIYYLLAVIKSLLYIYNPLISSFVNSNVLIRLHFSIFQILNLPSEPPVIKCLQYNTLHNNAPVCPSLSVLYNNIFIIYFYLIP